MTSITAASEINSESGIILWLVTQGKNALAVLIFTIFMAAAASSDHSCGMVPSDWCPAPPGDPCGRHRTVASCRADPACYGMPYRGESVVACLPDPRGFSPNCPTVGCASTPPRATLTTIQFKWRGQHRISSAQTVSWVHY